MEVNGGTISQPYTDRLMDAQLRLTAASLSVTADTVTPDLRTFNEPVLLYLITQEKSLPVFVSGLSVSLYR